MTELLAKDLTLQAGDTILLDQASFTLKPGELITLLGPNGAGKTSLIRASLGLEMPVSGTATLGDEALFDLSPQSRARQVSYLPQSRPLAWPNPVRDVVALGRFSYGAALGRLSQEDAAAVQNALASCDLLHLADRRTDTLSGGELARVHCARAFAAQTPLLIADEPIAALDPKHQFKILDLIQSYVSQGGGALVVLHDLGLAARYATRMIWMKGGRIIADGPTSETLSEARIEEIYGVKARIENGQVSLVEAL